MLHYAGPPGVGGVEATLAHHARGLADLGCSVKILSGRGEDFDPRVETVVNPRFGSSHPDILAAKSALDHGTVPDSFYPLRDSLVQELAHLLRDCDAIIAHNIHTLNKNLVLTAALAQLQETRPMIAWCHDLAWTNPQYVPELHAGYPWELLRQRWTNTHYVTVSEPRQAELARLLGVPPETITVAVPGVDVGRFLRWTPTTAHIVERLKLLDATAVLLLPARITRRKNIAFALRVVHALVQHARVLHAQADFRLIVTGPPGPHNPANPGYLGELLDLRRMLDLDQHVHFLYELGTESAPLIPDDDTVADLFQVADALFFPSIQEGFGIPMLEAAITRLPIYCADIPPFRSIARQWATYFDPIHASPQDVAETLYRSLIDSPHYQMRHHMRQHYRWDILIRETLIPLIEKMSKESS